MRVLCMALLNSSLKGGCTARLISTMQIVLTFSLGNYSGSSNSLEDSAIQDIVDIVRDYYFHYIIFKWSF